MKAHFTRFWAFVLFSTGVFSDSVDDLAKRNGCGDANVNAAYAYLSAFAQTSFCSAWLGVPSYTATCKTEPDAIIPC
jgi:hypothetical protein